MCLVSSLRRGCEAGPREERRLMRVRMVGAGRVEEAERNKSTGGPGGGLDMWGLSHWP